MKKGPPERSEGVLLSTARRDNGICRLTMKKHNLVKGLLFFLCHKLYLKKECFLSNLGLK
jgi:hypothetical protein